MPYDQIKADNHVTHSTMCDLKQLIESLQRRLDADGNLGVCIMLEGRIHAVKTVGHIVVGDKPYKIYLQAGRELEEFSQKESVQ